jgi:hypothetical protein
MRKKVHCGAGNKTIVDRETGVFKTSNLAMDRQGLGGSLYAVAEDDEPVEYGKHKIDFTCKRCHHQWSETETDTRRT